MSNSADDETHMRRAIALAATRVGKTAENPAVGCIIVKDGEVVGEGVTGEGGRPHAEELALDQAGERAGGATAYVTLEPCGERSSGAPSCSQRLVMAGVDRVVVAASDASPYAAGVGVARLRASGVKTDLGLMSREAAALYEGYFPGKIVRPEG